MMMSQTSPTRRLRSSPPAPRRRTMWPVSLGVDIARVGINDVVRLRCEMWVCPEFGSTAPVS